jgi:hypothetical protein
MKKIVLPIFAALIVTTGMSSCLFRVRKCECVTTNKQTKEQTTENVPVAGGSLFGGKSSSEAQCETYNSDDTYESVVCKLK